MSNFDFMNQQNLIVEYAAFKKMYDYIITAERNYYVDKQMCGMNVRWTLEQFCCLISDLKGVTYRKNPTYMGAFLSKENKINLALAVNSGGIYQIICDVNQISRQYAHSIAKPDEETYKEMLPKMFELIIWLYKCVLGVNLQQTYSSFTYDKVPKNVDIPAASKKEDTIHISSGQVDAIKQLFPNCDTSTSYSVQKTKNGLQLVDEDGNIIESYINENTRDEDAEEKKRLEEEIKIYQTREENNRKEYEKKLAKQNKKIRQLKSDLTLEQCSNSSRENKIVELTGQIELAVREKDKLKKEHKRKITKMQKERDSLQEAYDELVTEKERAEVIQRILKESVEEQNAQKKLLETEVINLTSQISEAEKKINEMENTFQTKNEAYKVLVKIKNKLFDEKHRLEILLGEAKGKYVQLSAFMETEFDKYKTNQIHLETLLANAQAQTAYYKRNLEELKAKMNEDAAATVVDQVICFQRGYEVYQVNKNEEAFRQFLGGMRNIIDEVREEVEEERSQREKENRETNQKIKKVAKMNHTTQKLMLVVLVTLCLPLTCIIAFVLMENSELKQKVNKVPESQVNQRQEDVLIDYTLADALETEVKLEKENSYDEENGLIAEMASDDSGDVVEENADNIISEMETEEENLVEENLVEENLVEENEVTSATPDDSKMEEIIEKHIKIPEDFTQIPGINVNLLEDIYEITSSDYQVFQFYPEKFQIYDLIDVWCVDETADYFRWTDVDMTIYKESEYIKFLYLLNQNIMYAVSIDEFVDGLNSASTFDECQQVFGDNVYVHENAHPTSFSTSQKEEMTMFILGDGSKVLLGWNEEGKICDYVYFYPLVKKYMRKLEEQNSVEE